MLSAISTARRAALLAAFFALMATRGGEALPRRGAPLASPLTPPAPSQGEGPPARGGERSQVSAWAGVPSLSLRFREVSGPWGLHFRHHNAGTGNFYMIETMGSGVVIWDYDGDGDQDILFLDSGTLPGYTGKGEEAPHPVLYRNDGGGHFTDVTERSGLRITGYGMGATAGDIDGDGDLDLYVTAFGRSQLFRNNGDGTFTDVTDRAGVGVTSWTTSAAFADADKDGDLDLYVASYVDFSFANNPICGLKAKNLRSYCHPEDYNPLPHHFFRNRGDGTFEDATAQAGLGGGAGGVLGNGLGVIWGDVDDDGWPDLFVANDMTPSFLFHNKGNGTFEEIGLAAGVALSDQGVPEAGMGVDMGDLTGHGRLDLMVTHLDGQTSAVYGNQGGGLFNDVRYATKLAEPSIFKVGFGLAFGDFDQDGDLDVVVANGHIIHNVEQWGTGTTYKQRSQLFENQGDGRFREVESSGLDVIRSARGLAIGDLDGDGDLDVVINNNNDLAAVYENVGAPGGWLQVDLASGTGQPLRDRRQAGGRDRRQKADQRRPHRLLLRVAERAHRPLRPRQRQAGRPPPGPLAGRQGPDLRGPAGGPAGAGGAVGL